jgi:hypothetical protein
MKNKLRAAYAWFLAYAILFWFALAGCGVFGANSAKAEHFNCQVRALQPVVGDVLDAEQLMRDLYSGKASLGSVLANVDATEAEVKKLLHDLHACEPPVDLPEEGAAS